MKLERQIQLISRLVWFVCIAGVVCLIPYAVISWVVANPAGTLLSLGFDLLPDIIFLPIFFFVAKLAKRYIRNDYFSKTPVRYLRQIAAFLFASQISTFVVSSASHLVPFVFFSSQFKLIFLSFVFYLVSLIAQKGGSMQEELDFTI
jgi:Protein of unknown function (DUF2975)